MKTILVVDDDEAIRTFVQRALTKHGWDVLEAEDGVDGVARFMLHLPEVLLTDISMPKSDGFEMIQILRAGGFLRGTRVIVMSGVMNLESASIQKLKADALLSKPFSLQDLYDAVGA